MDLPGKCGEHQLRNQEVFYGKREQTDAGVSAGSCAACTDQRSDATGDRGGSGHRATTLTRWLSQERDVGEPNEAPVDVHAELKRLRRENAILKRERDILKKAAAFFAKEGCGG